MYVYLCNVFAITCLNIIHMFVCVCVCVGGRVSEKVRNGIKTAVMDVICFLLV
jgi:hypothetical protein